MNQSLPPSGWYPDPAGSGDERFWDGVNWSQSTRPKASAGPGAAPQWQGSGAGAPGPSPSYPAGGAAHTYGQAPIPGAMGGYSSAYYGQSMAPQPAMFVAGWWWRLLAYILDAFILSVPVSLLQNRFLLPAMDAYTDWLIAISQGGPIPPFPPELLNALLWSTLLSAVVWIAYRTVMVGWKGASAGQLICGMRVIRDGDQSLGVPSWGVAAGRAVLAMVLFSIPLVGLINGLWPLFNDKRQTLHDLAVGTVVLKKR